MPRAAVQGPVHAPRNPNPAPPQAREENPRRRKRGRKKGRRKNPKNPGISYKKGALIGAVLGGIGVAIASAAKVPIPLPVIGTDEGDFAVDPTSSTKRALKGALRGAAVGLAVGVAVTAVARELKVGKAGRLMNPTGPGSAVLLGSTICATTLALDSGITKVIEAA